MSYQRGSQLQLKPNGACIAKPAPRSDGHKYTGILSSTYGLSVGIGYFSSRIKGGPIEVESEEFDHGLLLLC
jgi:hypothetical protein